MTTDRAENKNNSTGSTGSETGITRRKWFRPILAVATCVCLALALIPISGMSIFKGNGSSGSTDEKNRLLDFTDYDELEKTIDDIIENEQTYYYGPGQDTVDLAEAPDGGNAASDVTGPMAGSTGGMPKGNDGPVTDSGNADHSSTYNQVDGVDEADVVKTDGKYIYHVSYLENRVLISSAREGRTKRLSGIDVKGDDMIDDIYIDGDRLIVISETQSFPFFTGGYKNSSPAGGDKTSGPSVTVTCYDISDRTKPTKTDSYTQSGSLLSSRMTGGEVLLVTNQRIFGDRKDGRIPTVAFGDGKPVDLDIGDIQCIPSPATATYTIVGKIDPSKGRISEKSTRTRAVLGGSEQIYCSSDELYITATVLNDEEREHSLPWIGPAQMNIELGTRILKVDFSKKKMNYSAMGTIPGTVNDQFSMDARDGYFRIATTSHGEKGDTNDLFILDGDLKEVGSLRNFARDEHIEAVRYIGNYAYVITYEQIDPLFIIDLSDPGDPEIKGHVKISGFSTLLLPVDGDHVLGFGFATEASEMGESTDGLKLALFDVSDPAKPKVADAMSFKDVSSEIQYDHKALLVGPKGTYYAIPYDRFHDEWIEDAETVEDMEIDGEDEGIDKGRKGNADFDNGIMVFDSRNGKLKLKKQFESDATVKRCIYIGDYIYAICTDDSINSYKL